MGTAKQKAETLGMPHGTANNRLRKSVMFKYVKLAGDNFCYKCGAEIESVEDISIEHKLPWEGVSADLFFDLDNIAFSHVQCNRPDRPFSGSRGWYEEGTKRCWVCREVQPLEHFHASARTIDKRQAVCKPCKKIQDKIRRG